jgi:uncharacterized protein YihD (DUF1040 family)
MQIIRWMKPAALIVGCCALLYSCESGSNQQGAALPKKAMDSTDMAKAKDLEKMFFSIPAPMEMASLIREAGFGFDKAMLNSTDHVSRYTGEMKQAINLGIYGADLSYSSIFDQKQESMNYLAAAQKLAREMGVEQALDDKTIERLNANQDSRDSIMKIVSEAYADLNGFLKENDRVEISALVVSGGWLEALYLSTQYAQSGKPQIRQRIGEQKYSLENLISYFSKFGEKPVLNEMKQDLAALKVIFDEVKVQSSKTTTAKDNNGLIIIGNSSSVDLTDETLKKIETKVKEIRSKYTA